MLSKGIQGLAGTIAQDDLIAQIRKEGMPEGQVVIQIQNERDTDFSPNTGNPLQLQQLLIFIIIQIRQLFLVDLSAHRSLTLVAGDMLCPIRKGIYGQIAVIGAQCTMKGLGAVGKAVNLFLFQKRGGSGFFLLRNQCEMCIRDRDRGFWSVVR